MEKEQLRREKEQLRTLQQSVLLKHSLTENSSPPLIEFPPFDPKRLREVDFPFFSSNGEKYLTLLERDDLLSRVNAFSTGKQEKYTPFVVSTSRGMGKTFFYKW